MTLKNDVCRCAGRRNMKADTEVCPHRATCQRYKSAVAGEFGPRSPCAMWLCQDDRFDDYITQHSDAGAWQRVAA